ncbi:DUF916 domain-containing protein [Patescibacteria group bacterium]|nr:DUF916 domain-containing protein [Patescibacteria group bacterium]MBU4056721.1 DUF916 domain-containing protein [Patescibacteria group bacterium]
MSLKKRINPIRYFQSNGTRILIVGLLGFFALASFCYAISYGGLGIYPNESEWNEKNSLTKSWFIYTLEPSEVKEAKVNVVNQSEQSVEVKIYPVDAVTTKDGAFAPQSEDREKIDVGAWINMPVSELSLKPNETKAVDFTIKVPENAEVGDHMGAIIVQSKEAPEAEKGTVMKVVSRVGARIYLTVPGEIIKELEFKDFNWKMEESQVVFYLTLANKGNVRIAPKGEIEIQDESGNAVDKIKITEREVFPKDTIVLPTKWEKTTVGKFIALAAVNYGTEKNLTKKLSFEVESAQKHQKTLLETGLIVGGIIILLIIFFAVRKKFDFKLVRK